MRVLWWHTLCCVSIANAGNCARASCMSPPSPAACCGARVQVGTYLPPPPRSDGEGAGKRGGAKETGVECIPLAHLASLVISFLISPSPLPHHVGGAAEKEGAYCRNGNAKNKRAKTKRVIYRRPYRTIIRFWGLPSCGERKAERECSGTGGRRGGRSIGHNSRWVRAGTKVRGGATA